MSKTEKSFPRNFTGCLTCVQVLNIMVLLGFMLNYALRVNLTIAIVEMILPTANATNVTDTANVTDMFNVTEHPHREQTRYQWDTTQKNMLLGCFFWGYVLTELPGGRLAEIIGARRVFGYSTLLASILTLLSPGAAAAGFGWIVALRVLLGFLLGATWPAILPMVSKWIPPMDRSKFMSNMMASSLGAAMTMPICGFLIAHLGWESSFYFTGIIGLMWSLAWFAVVYDSPAEHPRISDTERNYLLKVLPQDDNAKKGHQPVPWCQMLTSPPVWAIIITHGCSVFGYFTVVNQLPTYIESILHYSIKHNGLLSSLPYLGKYLCALASSVLADSLRRSGRLSTTSARKLFTGFAVGLPGVLMVAQAFFGHDRVWSVAIFTIALTINGAVTAGYLGNGLDIAPNFSGTIFGMANTLSSLGGWLSTFMVGELTKEHNTYAQWQIVFFILAGVYVVGALSFIIFGSGELQPWNARQQIKEQEPLNDTEKAEKA
ncbi:sialin [Leguminivora glycinivorella]|uniref:sialin n=1 Tax=Leguminivora glycinivorella TaxID=1035111 RepID=UPI00200F6C1D|nr:sialin [Leguminivora glycinivorella]